MTAVAATASSFTGEHVLGMSSVFRSANKQTKNLCPGVIHAYGHADSSPFLSDLSFFLETCMFEGVSKQACTMPVYKWVLGLAQTGLASIGRSPE